MKFITYNRNIFVRLKLLLTIWICLFSLELVEGTQHLLFHKNLIKHLNNNIPNAPPMKTKGFSKSSVVPKVPISFKEHFDKKIQNSKKKENPSNHISDIKDLPTLEEINNHQGEKHSVGPKVPMPYKDHFDKKVEIIKNKENSPSIPNTHIDSNLKIKEEGSSLLKSPSIIYKKSSSSSEGFFQKTTKTNQSTAWKALGGFILGFILFFVSIQFICWNERRAVKFTSFIDWVHQDKNCFYLGQSSLNGEKPDNKAYIMNGNLNVTKQASVDIFDFENILKRIRFLNSNGKILFMKICVDKFCILSEKETGNVKVDENGNEQDEYVVNEDWQRVEESKLEKLGSKLYSGNANISGLYSFDLDRIKYLCENSDNYSPIAADLNIIEKMAMDELTTPLKVFLRGDYFYIIRSRTNTLGEEFDPELFPFKDNDRRLSIRYYLVNEAKPTTFTIAGKLEKIEGDMYALSPFESPIKHAQYNYYLCCFGETKEAYKVDIISQGVLDKNQIISDYEFENKACTNFLRFFGFIIHFLSYYLILYPLILLIGMIPFLGAIGTTALTIFAFLFSLITYMLIIAVAWLFARPLFSFLAFAFIGVSIFMLKISREKFGKANNYHDYNNSDNMNYNRNGDLISNSEDFKSQRKFKFL